MKGRDPSTAAKRALREWGALFVHKPGTGDGLLPLLPEGKSLPCRCIYNGISDALLASFASTSGWHLVVDEDAYGGRPDLVRYPALLPSPPHVGDEAASASFRNVRIEEDRSSR
jgi:hypothetical protein